MPCPLSSTRRKFYSSKPCDKLVTKTSIFNPCCSQNDIDFLKGVSSIYIHRTRTTEEESLFMDKIVGYINRYHRIQNDFQVQIHPNTKNGMNLLILAEKFRSIIPLTIFLTTKSGFIPLPEYSSRALYILQDLERIQVPTNKMMTISGNKSSVLYNSIDYFKNNPEDVVKSIKGLTYLKIEIPIVKDGPESEIISDVAKTMITLGKLVSDDIMFTKTVFKFIFVSSTLSSFSAIRNILREMAFEDHPKGSLYTEQRGDVNIKVEITNSEHRDISCILDVQKQETLQEATVRQQEEEISARQREEAIATRQRTNERAINNDQDDREPTEAEMTTHVLEQAVVDTRHVHTTTRGFDSRRTGQQVHEAENMLREWESQAMRRGEEPILSSLLSRYRLSRVHQLEQDERLEQGTRRIEQARNERLGIGESHINRINRQRAQRHRETTQVNNTQQSEPTTNSEIAGYRLEHALLDARIVHDEVVNRRTRLTVSRAHEIDQATGQLNLAENRLRDWERARHGQRPSSLLSRRLNTEQRREQQDRLDRGARIIQQYHTSNTPVRNTPVRNTPVRNTLPPIVVPKLHTKNGDKDVLYKSMATDIITFEEMSVEYYLQQDSKNMVLFESNFKPHFTNMDDLKVAMEDGIVYACKEVSTRLTQPLSNVEIETELFNARRIGTLSGYIDAKNLKSAIQSVSTGSSRMFFITEGFRNIPAVISKKVFNQMDSLVSANHCQEGAEGSVHNIEEFII